MISIPDDPIIGCIQRTGYPPWIAAPWRCDYDYDPDDYYDEDEEEEDEEDEEDEIEEGYHPVPRALAALPPREGRAHPGIPGAAGGGHGSRAPDAGEEMGGVR